MSGLSFRGMAWWFRIADFFFPKRGRLAGFGIREGMAVVDYGCGPGRYVEEASRRVGPSGTVFAVDIHPLAIDAARRVRERRGLANVVPALAQEYASGLPAGAADLIYALDMFHGVGDPGRFLAELHRIAKPNALLILEDGHQTRANTREKVERSGLWRIVSEAKGHVTCVPAPSVRELD